MSNDLNRSIAEKVMDIRTGHRCGDAAGPPEEGFRECESCYKGTATLSQLWCDHDQGWDSPINYLHDPVAVFGPGGVVEKMAALGWDCTIIRHVSRTMDKNYEVSFDKDPSPVGSMAEITWPHGNARSDFITQAVCLAALAALEG